MSKQDLLPLGSIVILKDSDIKLMIFGRVQRAKMTNEPYDYTACFWPEGNLSVDHTFLFNHEHIETVIHRGYSDDEDAAYLKTLTG